MPDRISAIIVTYNSSSVISDCLRALLGALPPESSEIIVVDNASTDPTLEVVKRFQDRLRVIAAEKNEGFAAGVNRGIVSSCGDPVLLINPDLIINPACVRGMSDFLQTRERAAVVGVRLVSPDGRSQPSRRRYPRMRAILANRIALMKRIFGGEVLGRYLMEDGKETEPEEVEWIIGACMMFQRRALEEVGLFDPKFFLYFEDADWCYRAREAGWKVFYLPKVEAVHLYQRESSRGVNRQLYWHLQSLARLYRKHGFRF